ncbi:MAG: glycine dehydrogenase (aminomethyl-transferring), partial [Gammaproteobacteria bacterium]|nr:glycine dehydrogenase (aminomethyl-transferring) [Gammaproteobacteria bacterium]
MKSDLFSQRHLGPRQSEIKEMLETIGVGTMDELVSRTIPKAILRSQFMNLAEAMEEQSYLERMREIASKNLSFRTYMGLGFYNTILPSVIQRHILENPNWYTSYTPYQAEISQGRLEALLNYQTVVMELTGLEIANASLLDESSAAAEAMIMLFNARSRAAEKEGRNRFFVDENTFPQTKAVLINRAEPLGIELQFGSYQDAELDNSMFGSFIQYPAADGEIRDYSAFTGSAHEKEIAVAVAADIMSLVMITPPGEWGADIVFGSTQRFGVPMGYGGPHAAFFTARETYKRNMPGRIIGVTKDIHGNRALRMALQTREQHIKREKATSNICTAQALLANMAGFFGVYHGSEGIKMIAGRVYNIAAFLSSEIEKLGYTQLNKNYFDTIRFALPKHVMREDIEWLSHELEMNFRYFENGDVGISIDETTNREDISWIIEVFAKAANKRWQIAKEYPKGFSIDKKYTRTSGFMTQEVFNKYRSETEMVRYLKRLEQKDISLTHSMIPLGSCTMKLNAATEMLPLSWIEFNGIHPFVPKNQARGYHEMMEELRRDLSEITGMADVSLMPNSG